MSSTRCLLRRTRSLPSLASAVVVALLVFTSGANAASLAELRAQIDALARARDLTISKQEGILAGLEAHAKQLYALVDQGKESEARSMFESLHPPLKALHDLNDRHTDALEKATIAADGDLEATQARQDFRDAELGRLRALYHLNWVSYLGATLIDAGSRRTSLLEFAATGFGEFVIGPDEAIARESLFGRAQALKELGRTNDALADFRRIIELGPKFPQYTQARMGAAEALLAAGRVDEAVREASSIAADASAGTLAPELGAQARLLKAQALFGALKKKTASDRSGTLREAISTLREVERFGGTWKRKAEAVASWGLEGLPEADMAASSGFGGLAVAQSLMIKGQYAKALDRLEPVIASGDTAAADRTEARFYAGLAAFQLQRPAVAAKHFRAYLDAAPRSRDAPEAAYLLFKALEELAKTQPSPQTDQAFRQALVAFLENYSQHPSSAEARFRRAELLRDEGDVLGAVAEFRKVSGNPTLEFYARFNAAQAMFSRMQDPPADVSAEQIESERKGTIADLEQLIGRLRKASGSSVPTTDLEAKATLMAALLAVQGSPDYPKALALTEGFSKRFPGKPELARQAFAIEVLALQKAGNVERAESAVVGYVDTFATEPKARQRIMKRLGREFFAQAEAELEAERPEVAAASARIAIAIYKRLRNELEPTATNEAARRGIHAMIGALHAKLGENPAAIEEFTALLALDSRSQEALRGLAEVATQTADHAKAASYWTRLAALLDPKDPAWLDARYAAAKAAATGGDRQGGCRTVKETHEKSPYPLIGKDKARFGELERTYCTS